MRDHMLGWPPALDHIDQPTEWKSPGRTLLATRRDAATEAMDRNADALITAKLGVRKHGVPAIDDLVVVMTTGTPTWMTMRIDESGVLNEWIAQMARYKK